MTSSRFGCNDGFALAGRMSDRRGQSRLRRARIVQVVHDGDAADARCRDFSDSGMKLDLTSPLELNDVVSVALSPTIVLYGSVAWLNGRECGIVFDGSVDSAALLEAAEFERDGCTNPETLALLASRFSNARAAPPRRDAPPTGVHFEPGLAVTVMVSPDQEQRGVVRWAKENFAALELSPIGAELVTEHRPARPALRLSAPK